MSAGYYEFESFLSYRKQRHSARLMPFGKSLFVLRIVQTHKYTVRTKCVVLIIKNVVHMLTTTIRYHTECTEHLDLYSSHTAQTTESGHIARMGQKSAYEVSVQYPEQDRPLQELETDERELECI